MLVLQNSRDFCNILVVFLRAFSIFFVCFLLGFMEGNSKNPRGSKPRSIFPQIAGSYRGSYFSKVGLLITEIAAAPASSFVSLHLSPCMLIPKIPASSFVSLHLSPCMLITEIAAAPRLPSFVSLHLSPCMLIPKIPASSFVSLYLSPCMLISKIPASSFVSFHSPDSWKL